ADNESGFTIVEVLVAIVLLLVGVLGVVQMIDTANAVTDNTKAREGAVALGRQVLEDPRTITYTDPDTSGSPSTPEQDPNAASGGDKGAIEQGTSMGFNVTTSSPASSVTWVADDGVSGGSAKQTDSAGVQWQFTWIYPTTPKPPLNDGPHTVTVQAFLAGL